MCLRRESLACPTSDGPAKGPTLTESAGNGEGEKRVWERRTLIWLGKCH